VKLHIEEMISYLCDLSKFDFEVSASESSLFVVAAGGGCGAPVDMLAAAETMEVRTALSVIILIFDFEKGLMGIKINVDLFRINRREEKV
jgi:hypothetical protein